MIFERSCQVNVKSRSFLILLCHSNLKYSRLSDLYSGRDELFTEIMNMLFGMVDGQGLFAGLNEEATRKWNADASMALNWAELRSLAVY